MPEMKANPCFVVALTVLLLVILVGFAIIVYLAQADDCMDCGGMTKTDLTAAYATNTAIYNWINGTATAKSWTATPFVQ